eukprot:CAMPEP_0115890672 /NCGR_PEP_ID=MMETSP0287-20121206/33470_1 /TAXON_ID=412157 /ORGANISM="Chrysochromulina rotalis, Strain UIO044" /LENGTH=32 /DNA_ID= /DNA_START= /DNA_END= /DNA_ORIENTATION=
MTRLRSCTITTALQSCRTVSVDQWHVKHHEKV